jgi:hypothetical protein
MTPKTANVLYWISTIIFAALMIMSAVPNITKSPESVQMMNGMLGYPIYFIPFIGWAKLLGSITILVPNLKRIKEWAYAGLFFDLGAAIYSAIAVAGKVDPMMFMMLIWIIPGVVSYHLWTRR